MRTGEQVIRTCIKNLYELNQTKVACPFKVADNYIFKNGTLLSMKPGDPRWLNLQGFICDSWGR